MRNICLCCSQQDFGSEVTRQVLAVAFKRIYIRLNAAMNGFLAYINEMRCTYVMVFSELYSKGRDSAD